MVTVALASVALLAAPAPSFTFSGWVVSWNSYSLDRLEKYGDKVDIALVEWTGTGSDGIPFQRPLWTAETKKRLFDISKKHGIKLYAMASNYVEPEGFDSARMTKIFSEPATQAKHIATLTDFAKKDGFAGIDLDYEAMKAADKDGFSRFCADLKKACSAKNLKLSVTVHPKVNDEGGWEGPRAQDYAAIGKVADEVRLMCYDYTWSGSEAPGPIAPDDWVENVAKYALTKIPASKLHIGIANYGYDWSAKPGKSIIFEDRPKSKPTLDPRSGEQVYNGKIHFGGKESAIRKIAIARKLGLAGVASWYIGSEEPETWEILPKR